MPIIIADTILLTNKINPKTELLNIIAPTLFIKNIGEEVEQKVDALTPSLSFIAPFSFRSQTIFAPIGYPAIRLIKNAYPHAPLVLKSLLVSGENLPTSLPVMLSEDSIAVIKK